MTERKRVKKALRYAQLLARRPATLRATGDPESVLLEFAGERSVRCPRDVLEELQHRGMVRMGTEAGEKTVRLGPEGLLALRRERGGREAGRHQQLRHADIAVDGQEQPVVINDAESPLATLARMRRPNGKTWLDRAEAMAGERLRCDFERAMLQPRVTASWDVSRVARAGKGGRNTLADFSDGALAARQRVNAAIAAVGPELGGAMVDVCCFLKGLEEVERERGWPRRSAKLMLKTALAMLDRHYHPPPENRRTAQPVLHWGADGYRPQMVVE